MRNVYVVYMCLALSFKMTGFNYGLEILLHLNNSINDSVILKIFAISENPL